MALPAQEEVLSTVTPPPAPSASWPRPGGRPVRRAAACRRQPEQARAVPAPAWPNFSARTSSRWDRPGAKVAAVLRGQADAYVHAGGQYEWDSAAPVAVARAAGFHASRIDGRELSYNQADLLMPDILVCPPALAGALLDAIRSAQSGETSGSQR